MLTVKAKADSANYGAHLLSLECYKNLVTMRKAILVMRIVETCGECEQEGRAKQGQ